MVLVHFLFHVNPLYIVEDKLSCPVLCKPLHSFEESLSELMTINHAEYFEKILTEHLGSVHH